MISQRKVIKCNIGEGGNNYEQKIFDLRICCALVVWSIVRKLRVRLFMDLGSVCYAGYEQQDKGPNLLQMVWQYLQFIIYCISKQILMNLSKTQIILIQSQSRLDIMFFQNNPIQDYKLQTKRTQMNCNHQQDPFHIVRNYRKMIARRDRHHKKRKPKLYPPTSIRTRSMELRQQKMPSQEMIDLEHYDSMPPNSQSWYDTESRDFMLIGDCEQKSVDGEMNGPDVMGLMQNEKLLAQNEQFLFWDNDNPVNDMGDHQLLSIH